MKTVRSLFGVLVVVAVFYTAWKIIPPYFNEYQFEDAIAAEARFSSYNQTRTEQDIRDAMAKKAAEYDLPLKADDIHVTRSGPEITIWADYTVHVDLPGYPFDLKFHPNSKNKRTLWDGFPAMARAKNGAAAPRQITFRRALSS